ncbi:SDR family oxidoreductase [Propionivibrio soli]|uniref:SDR family oxidoreductase n=1 Tax=Propionivibrio soli TaxID=2976531 RepID=UPI0021E8656C|nr:SDR family oxidoreductase [Propionivibrio soli]
MQLTHARILLTGASGGLGYELARQLSGAGAALLLAGREPAKLAELRALLTAQGGEVTTICADLTRAEGVAVIARAAQDFRVNVLVNNAGASAFGLFENQEWPTIERVLATSLEAPIHLTHALVPWLRAQPQAAIVNIGSMFGSLPFPGFAAYSAAKAGLRAFSQALRRELSDSLVSVVHISPRAIDTPMNSGAVNALNAALDTHSDQPSEVAREIVAALARNEVERHIGFPERLFAWVNGLAPQVIDRALAGKLPTIKQHAARPH